MRVVSYILYLRMRVYILYILYLRMRVYILYEYLHMRVYILYLCMRVYILYLRMTEFAHVGFAHIILRMWDLRKWDLRHRALPISKGVSFYKFTHFSYHLKSCNSHGI